MIRISFLMIIIIIMITINKNVALSSSNIIMNVLIKVIIIKL